MSVSDEDLGVVSNPNKQTPEEVAAYWTPERMAGAKPVPMPSPTAGYQRLIAVAKDGVTAAQIEQAVQQVESVRLVAWIPLSLTATLEHPMNRAEYIGRLMATGVFEAVELELTASTCG